MQARIQKWGDSLALRIPLSVAAETGLQENSTVELTLVDGQLVVRALESGALSLDSLLSEVTEANLHGELPTGPSLGAEAW